MKLQKYSLESFKWGVWLKTWVADWLNSALSPVVYGDIALSINTQYNTKKKKKKKCLMYWLINFTGVFDS